MSAIAHNIRALNKIIHCDLDIFKTEDNVIIGLNYVIVQLILPISAMLIMNSFFSGHTA